MTAGIFFITLIAFTLAYYDIDRGRRLYTIEYLLFYLTFSISISLIGTLHYYWAYRKFLQRRHILSYTLACISVLLLAIAVCIAEYWVVNKFVEISPDKLARLITSFGLTLLIFGGPFAVIYTAVKEAKREKEKRKKIEATNRNMAAKLLSKKLEPHFLFNTLNAIYAIAQMESASSTVATIDIVSERLRGEIFLSVKTTETLTPKSALSLFKQFIFVWLGLLGILISVDIYGYLIIGKWLIDAIHLPLYNVIMVGLVAFSTTGHYYIVYKPFFYKGLYVRYVAMLLMFISAMILLDVSASILLLNVAEMSEYNRTDIGSLVLISTTRVLTIDVFCAWVYATVSHYKYIRRQRDVAIKEQEANEQKLQQSKSKSEAMFALLRELEDTVNQDAAPRTQAAVTELLSLFRYSAEHAGDITVPVKEELTFLQRYITLQQMRIKQGGGVRITTSITADDNGTRIAPMLFLPYIENAFKYGISYTADSFIDINISVTGAELNCNITNTDHAAARKGRPSARMGMADTLKRLQLQYEGKFTLECTAIDGLYTVVLHIKLE